MAHAILLALGVAGAAFGIATVVQAAIPDSHGVVHSCYQVAQGSVPQGHAARDRHEHG